MLKVEDIFNGICAKDTQALAKGITLLEDARDSHRNDAHKLTELCFRQPRRSFRVAISGPPGVGKSTLMEAIGLKLIALGKTIAVLTIDPSSSIRGGSILGDKTRMTQLSLQDNAFIRPSPSGGFLGGLGRHTPECMLLCDAAGYDYCFIETVGVGQSEIGAKQLVDLFITLQSAHAGDELQGIKKGILEVSDLIIITKADSGHEGDAQRAMLEHQRAQTLGSSSTHVLSVSAQTGLNMDSLIELLDIRSQSPRSPKSNEAWFRAELKALLADYVDQMKLTNLSEDCPASVQAYQAFEKLKL